jgi:glycosyltransferase involved in cell wall biosynthesis
MLMNELKRLSVLYFSSSAHIQGGAVQSMFRLARWLKQMGGNPLVVLPRPGDILQWYLNEDIDVRIIPFAEMHRRWSVSYLLRYLIATIGVVTRLVALIKREGIDIVHVNEIVYFPALIAARVAGIKSVCHVRVILEEPAWLKWLLPRLVSKLSDEVLCVSDAVRVNMFSPDTRNVRTLYNPGPDLDRFDPQRADDGGAVREQFGIGPDAFVVGLVSKFSPKKGHLSLVEAARMIRNCHPDMRVAYVVVGGTVPGHEDYIGLVKGKVAEYGLQDSFIFAGVQHDIPGLMAAADVMVHIPTHEDPFPGVVLEAMAMKKPVVAFASGGIGEQFENGRSGILLGKGDVRALGGTLVDLAHDPARRVSLGKAGRYFLTSRFSPQRFSAELERIYGSLCQDTRG